MRRVIALSLETRCFTSKQDDELYFLATFKDENNVKVRSYIIFVHVRYIYKGLSYQLIMEIKGFKGRMKTNPNFFLTIFDKN